MSGPDKRLAAAVIARELTELALEPIHEIAHEGTDTALFRVGPSALLRMPRHARAAVGLAREGAVLDAVRGLPLRVPEILARGEPDKLAPGGWMLCRWIDGAAPALDAIRPDIAAAQDLGRFVSRLHRTGAPAALQHGATRGYRAGRLGSRDALTRRAIGRLTATIDAGGLLQAWEAALQSPEFDGHRVLIHADLHAGNLIEDGGKLKAVIDWGMADWGDPALDFTPAWSLFAGRARDAFIEASGCNGAALNRARGWAISIAAIALEHYRGRNDLMEKLSRQTINAVLEPGTH